MIARKRGRSAFWLKDIVQARPLKIAKQELASRYLETSSVADEYYERKSCPVVKSFKGVRSVSSFALQEGKIDACRDFVTKLPGILDLPDDILLHIFHSCRPVPDLCRLMEVCRKFCEICLTPELWKCVQAVDSGTRRTDIAESDSAYKLIEYDSMNMDRNPKSAAMHQKSRKNYKSVGFVVDVITLRARSCLTSLDLSGCFPEHPKYSAQMTDADLDLISARSGSSLKSLRISPSFFISATGLLSFANSCPNLTTLHMTGCQSLTDKKLGQIILACSRLEDISVNRCWKIHGTRIHDKLHPIRNLLKRLDISDTAALNIQMAKFMTGYPALEVIKADGCHMLDDRSRTSDPMASFPKLTYLNLDRTAHISPKWLKLACMSSRNLRFLSLNMIRFMTNDITGIFKVDLPPLKYLGLAGHNVSDFIWQMIYEKLGGSLVQCDLSVNKALSGALVLGEARFHVLEYLSLRSTRFTGESVNLLLDIAPKLQFLDLSGCRRVERSLRRTPLSFRERSMNCDKNC